MEILIRLAPGGCRCVPGVRRLLGAARLNAGGSPTAKLRCNADRLELADDRHSSALAERLLPVSCGLHAVQRNVRSWMQIQPVATAHVYSDHAVKDGWHSTTGAPPCPDGASLGERGNLPRAGDGRICSHNRWTARSSAIDRQPRTEAQRRPRWLSSH